MSPGWWLRMVKGGEDALRVILDEDKDKDNGITTVNSLTEFSLLYL